MFIQKYRLRFGKRNTVSANVGLGLALIPRKRILPTALWQQYARRPTNVTRDEQDRQVVRGAMDCLVPLSPQSVPPYRRENCG